MKVNFMERSVPSNQRFLNLVVVNVNVKTILVIGLVLLTPTSSFLFPENRCLLCRSSSPTLMMNHHHRLHNRRHNQLLLFNHEGNDNGHNGDNGDKDRDGQYTPIIGRRKFIHDVLVKSTAATVALSVLTSTKALDDNYVMAAAATNYFNGDIEDYDKKTTTTSTTTGSKDYDQIEGNKIQKLDNGSDSDNTSDTNMIAATTTTNIDTTNMIVATENNQDKNEKIHNQFDIRYFIAGGGCASISHGIATPFDVIKTKIQAQPDTYNSGFLNTAQSLIQNEGIGSLSTGLVPTLVGFGLEGAVKFGVYESLKPVCMSLLQSDEKTLPYLLASIAAGAVASTMLCPMERARIRLVTQQKKSDYQQGQDNDDDDNAESPGLFGGIGPMIQEEGYASLLYGYPAMLFKQVPYTITKQCTFDLFASSISIQAMSYLGDTSWSGDDIRLLSTVSAAFLASILACTASQPGDVILTKTLKGKNDREQQKSSSILSLGMEIFRENGLGGFYAGYSARLAHVIAIVTSQLVLYDFLKQLLGLPATVS